MTSESNNTNSNPNHRYQLMFEDKVILAPMVRENKLAFRLLALESGADLVYSEELIDYRLSSCKRIENTALGTIDFIDKHHDVVFRTCDKERGRIILQLGSNNPSRALDVAKLVSKDVAGIDFNFGCPKPFSLKGGMGASLLEKPDQIETLLKHLVAHLDMPVTCKIRILPDLAATLKLAKMIQSSGVSAIAVHGRTKDERPHHDNRNDYIKAIVDAVHIPVIANGGSNGFKTHSDILAFKKSTGASSVMVARAAMRNPSILNKSNELVEVEEMIWRYIKKAVRYENSVQNTKYALQALMSTKTYDKQTLRKFHSCADMADICPIFGLSEWYDSFKRPTLGRKTVTADHSHAVNFDELTAAAMKKVLEYNRVAISGDGNENHYSLISCYLPYKSKLLTSVESPKTILHNHTTKSRGAKPVYESVEIERLFYSLVFVDGRCFFNKAVSGSKKAAEQASALLAGENIGLLDLTSYRDRVLN